MPATDFDIAIGWLLRKDVEGVHANDPNDKGGDTWYGISRKAQPNEPWPPTRERCIEIYREEYWNTRNLPLDKFRSLPLKLVLFDGAVQHDPTDMAIMLQTTLNKLGGAERIVVDGWAGPQTLIKLKAITQFDRDRELAVALAVLFTRQKYYYDLSRRPGQLPNLRHWTYRMAALGELLIARHLTAL
ncbi:MAG: glycosyl hydrolase 108 family protein [Pseudomonadota bacterium]